MEVELKLRVDEATAADLARRLDLQVQHEEHEQVDTYYGHPCRDLVATDEALRVREDGATLEVTYKGPRRQDDLKVRPEINLSVVGPAAQLLEALGFRPAARLTKRRRSWRLPHVEVAVDHVDGLGWFVELESLGDSPHVIEEARRSLGLVDADSVPQSYLALALDADAAAVQRLE